MRALVPSVAAIGLLFATHACGDGSGGSANSSTSSVPTTTAAPSTSTSPTSTPPTSSAVITSTSTSTSSTSTTEPAPLVDVKVYLLRQGRLVIAHRQVVGPAVLKAALTALLEGPAAAERGSGVDSAVPAGTRLLDVALADGGQATVDVSAEYATGGGTLSMEARVAQIVFTATQFPNVTQVLFRMDGSPIEFLGGEGLILTDPQTRAMTDRSVTGAVLVDSPAPGAVVTSPFTVTGEGDVYEAQFPIEVWAGGRQVGGIAPVTAGAWGTWAPFEVTITVDAPPGPMELVAYDEGGCGTDPECPPIIKTIVPLTLS